MSNASSRGAPQPPPPAAAAPPPTASTQQQQQQPQQQQAQQQGAQGAQATSPHQRQAMPLPNPLAIPGAQGGQPAQGIPPQSPSYQPYGGAADPNAYMPPGYPGQPPAAPQYFQPPAHDQQAQGMTAWGPGPGVQHSNQYGRR